MTCIDSNGPKIPPTSRRQPLVPSYSGPYPAGVRHVESPVPTETFGTFKHRSMPDGRVGIAFDSVMFTLFYPAAVPRTAAPARVLWFPRLVRTVDGLLKVANWSSVNPIYKIVLYILVALLAWGTTFPGIENAPLREPPPEVRKWRVIMYSHGAGYSRSMSAVCEELVSRGYIVAAIEHRDGTGPSVQVTNECGETKDLYWLNWSQLEWMVLEEQPVDDAALRRVQLEVRTGAMSSQHDWEGWDVIEVTKPIIAGHSFRGSLATAAASDPGRRFDFSHVIAFDPATRRLEPWDKEISIPLLAINSGEYASGDEFSKLLAPSAETYEIYVIPGATHASFSDVFLILPDHVNRWIGLAMDPWDIIQRTIDTANRFTEHQDPDTKHMVRCHADGLFTIYHRNLSPCRQESHVDDAC